MTALPGNPHSGDGFSKLMGCAPLLSKVIPSRAPGPDLTALLLKDPLAASLGQRIALQVEVLS